MDTARGLEELTEQELDALLGAAAWYFSYQRRSVSEQAGDRSAGALVRRERFLALHGALWKLGVAMRAPDGLENT